MIRTITKRVVLFLLAGFLCSCGEMPNQEPVSSPEPSAPAVIQKEDSEMENNLPVLDETLAFDDALAAFIEQSGFENKNYMISPASFRAALLLAAAGAETGTKQQLLRVMDFKDMDEANAWYDTLMESAELFENLLNQEKESVRKFREDYGEEANEPDGAFQIENSVWRNTRAQGELREDYCRYVMEHYGAKAANVSPAEITEAVNGWIKEKTNGLIPMISPDLSLADLILVNTLYLRTVWMESFFEEATEEGNFTAYDGRTVRKEFMRKQDRYRYYEEENGKLIVLPMKGGINAVFILGEIENVNDKLEQTSYEEVKVCLPKFEIETSLEKKELIRFCRTRGCDLPFGENADFSAMSDFQPLFISDILQKTKIKTDEAGIEAAAATVIYLLEGMALMEEQEIKEFTADQPFRFMIITAGDVPEVLFLGRVAE